ncbi:MULTISPECIES: hypothetical protein [unclassified Mesorhizobium]|uniref:hypothetical protein n=1 Tax=unclassified Mesorhizobium TaxID=325217 RepID=UPI001CCCD85E|nr:MULTISPECIES: hypothetical protein [unclassified Mesorhizobium]MBZ9679639.1 hypothetical protein [Mesorhizobium sp. CO1-1-2]MBZ9925009.1 hypothetical protein [Mesorhizobium sp. BR1-1-4]
MLDLEYSQNVTNYRGSAWRSRFLRAPKIALELAGRNDFTRLDSLANVKLGIKTGSDDFFFLERGAEPTHGQLVSSRGSLSVVGKDNWHGVVSSKDLIPAILNPHQLYDGDKRTLRIGKQTKHVYLSPRPGALREDLKDYVRLGEIAGLPQQKLVAANAEDVWYRQSRSRVTSRWALPYNSAYDYGAWDNEFGAILNGRFVGAEAIEDRYQMLLGAVLNSTMTAMCRLLEGVATGVEGAFDVGPPAARKMNVPDIRRFEAARATSVLDAFEEMREANVMPPAPSTGGQVSPLRNRLDIAVLYALGMTTGQAIALLDRIYASYARWRGGVENVEAKMRSNRRAMNASGQTRTITPVEATGRRVWDEIRHEAANFPSDFIAADEVVEMVNIPVDAYIPTTEPLIESGIITTKKKRLDLKHYGRVAYARMLRTLGFAGLYEIPVSHIRCAAIVALFEACEAKLRTAARERAEKYVSGREAVDAIVGVVIRHWFKTCRDAALKQPENVPSKTSKN